MNDLPDKVVQLEVLRIKRNMGKRCKCEKPNYILDTDNREVTCGKCRSRIDAFDALYSLAHDWERVENDTRSLLEQRKEIVNYKPWLLVFRKLESSYRGKEMLPCCPECGKAFYFEQISGWTNRRMEELRRKRDG